MKTVVEAKEDIVRCPVCDTYVKRTEGFTCPRCRRGPLCKTHRVPGKKECASCIFDMKATELLGIRRQEQGIRSFLRLLQFLFVVFSILFVLTKIGIPDELEFLRHDSANVVIKLIGGISICGYIIFYILLLAQRGKASELESEISKAEYRRQFK